MTATQNYLHLTKHHPYSISTIFLTPQDVRGAISNIDPSKASGPDLISPRLLREGSEVLSHPLTTYFNKLIASSYFPLYMETSKRSSDI